MPVTARSTATRQSRVRTHKSRSWQPLACHAASTARSGSLIVNGLTSRRVT